MDANFDAPSLVAASLKGDRQAFGRIVARYQSAICGIAYAATGDLARSEDIAQDTFIAAWRRLATLREPEKLGAWIRAIARNAINSHYRRAGRDVIAAAEPIEGALELASITDDSPRERVVSAEERQLLWNTLAQLPERYREPLVLYYRQGRSAKDVAELLEISEDTVRQRLCRGRELLREQMAAFVESALERTGPKEVFTVAVLAALPALVPQAAAATTVAVATKGSTALELGGLTGFLGAALGPVLGLLGGYIGVRMSLKNARSPREKAFLKKSLWLLPAYVVIFVAFVVLANYLLGDLLRSTAWTIGFITLTAVIYTVGVMLGVVWVNKRIQRIRVEDGTDIPQTPANTERSKGHIGGAFVGGISGSTAGTIIAAFRYGPWWSGLIYLSVAITYCIICIRGAYRDTSHLWAHVRVAIVGVTALNMFAVIQFWEKPMMATQMSQMSALLTVQGIGVFVAGLSYIAEKRWG